MYVCSLLLFLHTWTLLWYELSWRGVAEGQTACFSVCQSFWDSFESVLGSMRSGARAWPPLCLWKLRWRDPSFVEEARRLASTQLESIQQRLRQPVWCPSSLTFNSKKQESTHAVLKLPSGKGILNLLELLQSYSLWPHTCSFNMYILTCAFYKSNAIKL